VRGAGELWRWLRASVAIPGVLPPVMHRGEVLVDGGAMNNLPVDVMRELGRGPVIGGAAADFDGTGSCWLETGQGEAAFAFGRFYAEPQPEVNLRSAGRAWHWGKVLFERYWLGRWPGRAVLRPLLRAGASLMGVPGQL